jgi:chemotaxis protein histidine kinase CheA
MVYGGMMMLEIKVLFIELSGTVYTIKTVLNIIDLITISAEHFNKILTNGNIHINNMSIPVVYPVDEYQPENDSDRYLVVLGNPDKNTGIIVDNIIGIGLITWDEEESEETEALLPALLN